MIYSYHWTRRRALACLTCGNVDAVALGYEDDLKGSGDMSDDSTGRVVAFCDVCLRAALADYPD